MNKGGNTRDDTLVLCIKGGGFLRVGKESIEEILEACFQKSLIMRTRPRRSDGVAECVGKREARACTIQNKIRKGENRHDDL